METVVGVFAHVDAGKTTLSEQLLYRGGTLRRAGRVDSGDTCLDHDVIERSRGITVFADEVAFTACGLPFRLIDTPATRISAARWSAASGPWTARYWW